MEGRLLVPSGNKTKLNCSPPRDVEGEGWRQAEGDIQASGLSVWMLHSAPDGKTGAGWQVWRGKSRDTDVSDFLSPFP